MIHITSAHIKVFDAADQCVATLPYNKKYEAFWSQLLTRHQQAVDVAYQNGYTQGKNDIKIKLLDRITAAVAGIKSL